MKVNVQAIPPELAACHTWLVWRYGSEPNKKGKLPKLPHDLQSGRCVDKMAAACYSLDQVLAANSYYEGIGIMPSGRLIALDFDFCYENGTITPWVLELLTKLNTYTEVSPSGNGLRAWIQGDAPKAEVNITTNPLGLHKRPVKGKFEIYPASPLSNYVTVTGDRLDQFPATITVLEKGDLAELYRQAEEAINKPVAEKTRQTYTRLQRFKILSLGDWPRLYPPPQGSQSDADLEFCVFLLEAAEGDQEATDRDFRQSKLFRPKWDEQRGALTYGRKTIGLALDKYLKDPKKSRKENQKPLAPLVVMDGTDLLIKNIKEREVWVRTKGSKAAIITAQSLSQIFAWRGVGKTNLALGLAGAMAKGTEFLCWEAVRKIKTTYVEGEMPASQFQERVRTLIGDTDPGFFRTILLDFQENNNIPALSTPEGRQLVDDALGDTEMLFLDSVSTLGKMSTNDEENWLGLLEWLMSLRSRGVSVMTLQHAGKAGLQRGHSRAEDNLDLSINLKNPEGYSHSEGLRCLLKFDKVRSYVPDGDDIEVRLGTEGFIYEFVKKQDEQRVADYLKTAGPDVSSRKAGKELGISHNHFAALRRKILEKMGNQMDGALDF